MNKLLEVNRELREIPDPRLRKSTFFSHLVIPSFPLGSREYYIKKIMATYNYDRDNAEKAFEYMKYKRANYTLGKPPCPSLTCKSIGSDS
jgi:hypothetical protein